MKRKVLSVGQCSADDATLRRVLTERYPEVEVIAVDTASEGFVQARTGEYALILVNRIFDADGESGLELIRELKAETATAAVPVMLVSNFADAQARAVATGALQGFGKATLTSPNTQALLDPLLK
jgi:DNA-binding response OmpR family regulator